MKITARRLPGEPETDLTDVFDIQFGEGASQVTVSVRDGWVEVQANRRLVVQPITTSTIRVTAAGAT